MADYDYLIVGAGLFGATFAHLATKAGKIDDVQVYSRALNDAEIALIALGPD